MTLDDAALLRLDLLRAGMANGAALSAALAMAREAWDFVAGAPPAPAQLMLPAPHAQAEPRWEPANSAGEAPVAARDVAPGESWAFPDHRSQAEVNGDGDDARGPGGGARRSAVAERAAERADTPDGDADDARDVPRAAAPLPAGVPGRHDGSGAPRRARGVAVETRYCENPRCRGAIHRKDGEAPSSYGKRRFCSISCSAIVNRNLPKLSGGGGAAASPKTAEEVAIAAHIAQHGVTKCPPAAAEVTSADLASQPGRDIIRQRHESENEQKHLDTMARTARGRAAIATQPGA